jgi:hypothetical protein
VAHQVADCPRQERVGQQTNAIEVDQEGGMADECEAVHKPALCRSLGRKAKATAKQKPDVK